MKPSFLARFLGFSVAFYVGSVVGVLVLTVVKTAVFFQHHFWSWILGWIKDDVFPIAVKELFRSPIMGLLFALLGARGMAPSSTLKFGAVCGAFSYATAYFFTILRSTGSLPQLYFRFNLIEYSLLGVPVLLILLSRFYSVKNSQA